MTVVKPIFRIFNYDKAIEFYIDWLGFKIDWEDISKDSPIYMQVSFGDIVLHLSEHYGDSSPGSRIYIEGFVGLKDYHAKLLEKKYKFMRPGLETTQWDSKILCMEVIDPFGNRLTFTGSEQ